MPYLFDNRGSKARISLKYFDVRMAHDYSNCRNWTVWIENYGLGIRSLLRSELHMLLGGGQHRVQHWISRSASNNGKWGGLVRNSGGKHVPT